jgi:hypothetical protein
MARFHETLRRLAMIDEGLVEDEAGLGLDPAEALALELKTAALLRVAASVAIGSDPGLDYCEVSAELQLVRGPYPVADGIAAYEEHRGLHPAAGGRYPAPAMTDAG